ncbi:MAG: FadR family transcriptional regulator [Candidatus Hydrogenedentes bacterium]|nr:FadR family transcriptional regulator [Candidatus Hydrogenedentota bacterium]
MSGRKDTTTTMAGALADRMLDEILNSELKEGDLFMTGDQVTERYAVSRTVAREALSQLQALGVLKGRQKKGVLVARPDPVRLSERWVPLYCRRENREDFNTLAQLRYVLELGAVDLAVARATAEQAERLGELAREFDNIAAEHGHSAEADKVDLAFHTVVLEMTGNPLLAGMHRVLSQYFCASAEFDPKPSASKAIQEHHMIAEAFRRRDVESVRTLLRIHMEDNVRG